MKKSLMALIIFLLTIALLYFGLQFYRPKIETYSNITELYSLFTPYMENYVNYRLQTIGCQPSKYYYDNSVICFVCKDMDACFGYGWVSRAEGEKMNPGGIPYLARVKEFGIKVVDFCEDGLASEFNCRNVYENVLECENIRVVNTNKDGIFECNETKIMLKEIEQFKNFIESFCRFKEEELENVSESLAFCGRYIIELREDKEIIIGER